VSVGDIHLDTLACHRHVQAAGHKQNPGLVTRGDSLQGVEGGCRLELANWIETNVSRRAGINAIGRQQAVILVGTEQALRRTDDDFGEAGLRVHGCVPWG